MYQETKIVAPEAGYPELRRWTRYKARLLTCVIAKKPMKALIISGHGSEINHGGMRIFAGIELAVNDCIRVTFTPPYGGALMSYDCIIRDRSGYTYGVEFIRDENNGEQTGQMQRLLDSLEDFNCK